MFCLKRKQKVKKQLKKLGKMKHILQCEKCKTFSMKEVCSKCGSRCESVRPAKFSLQDAHGRERRIAKKEMKEN